LIFYNKTKKREKEPSKQTGIKKNKLFYMYSFQIPIPISLLFSKNINMDYFSCRMGNEGRKKEKCTGAKGKITDFNIAYRW